ncbi:type IV toxin-antitoxin system AbiEi family antitoxin [uncultured Desulfovibrio sp.]|uniref:type IV toxin-antitoxin system AbiEi family antitoxin n=1 Tax=uncultured Desulfovibrio sp. TaxID=167968 RepID=UPI002617FAEC|nr:type IV toxin-antitoxin system AbiEi family antitoxin [uncultured Desulfovibrio sp.]
MNQQKRENLNQMLRQWPASGLRTAAALRAQGISSSLLHHYVQRRWLEQVERGVYRRPGDTPGWQAALHTVQHEMGLPVHVGGLTALELQGYGHYMGERPLFLYAPPRTRLPGWLEGAAGREVRFASTNFLDEAPQESLHTVTVEGVAITASTPERAALEMLYLVPGQFGFGEAMEIVGGLASLRVDLMQALLEGCSSVKVKRLFLYCARESGHSWYSALDRGRIDLGVGKRELVKGGKLDKEFLLTVEASPYTTEIRF